MTINPAHRWVQARFVEFGNEQFINAAVIGSPTAFKARTSNLLPRRHADSRMCCPAGGCCSTHSRNTSRLPPQKPFNLHQNSSTPANLQVRKGGSLPPFSTWTAENGPFQQHHF